MCSSGWLRWRRRGDVRACREERLTAAAQARMLKAMRLPDPVTGRRPQRRGPRGFYRPRTHEAPEAPVPSRDGVCCAGESGACGCSHTHTPADLGTEGSVLRSEVLAAQVALPSFLCGGKGLPLVRRGGTGRRRGGWVRRRRCRQAQGCWLGSHTRCRYRRGRFSLRRCGRRLVNRWALW